jgi:hypothetical protein
MHGTCVERNVVDKRRRFSMRGCDLFRSASEQPCRLHFNRSSSFFENVPVAYIQKSGLVDIEACKWCVSETFNL